jgi:hypothetical protein
VEAVGTGHDGWKWTSRTHTSNKTSSSSSPVLISTFSSVTNGVTFMQPADGKKCRGGEQGGRGFPASCECVCSAFMCANGEDNSHWYQINVAPLCMPTLDSTVDPNRTHINFMQGNFQRTGGTSKCSIRSLYHDIQSYSKKQRARQVKTSCLTRHTQLAAKSPPLRCSPNLQTRP